MYNESGLIFLGFNFSAKERLYFSIALMINDASASLCKIDLFKKLLSVLIISCCFDFEKFFIFFYSIFKFDN